MKKLMFIVVITCVLFLTACNTNQQTTSTTELEVLPNGLLFDHGDSPLSQFYNYAPSIFQEDENTRHIYYCANEIDGNVTDHIAYRKGTRQANDVWVYDEVKFVLKSTTGTWDERHTCDPDVIKGVFSYQGETYSYLMAYLGCVTSNNQENEVGLAVAKSPEGPWIKTEMINPIAKYVRNTEEGVNDKFQWGYGQPSLINIDKQSTVLLFYTFGNGVATGTMVEKWDFTDINHPIKIESKIITNKGLKNLYGQDDFINNADFAYDPSKRRIYAISEDHPYPSSYPDIIASSNKLIFMGDATPSESYQPGDILFNPSGRSWTEMVKVDKKLTGFDRNHNMTLLTDSYGWLINGDSIEVVYSVSAQVGNFWGALSTYRIHSVNLPITE